MTEQDLRKLLSPYLYEISEGPGGNTINLLDQFVDKLIEQDRRPMYSQFSTHDFIKFNTDNIKKLLRDILKRAKFGKAKGDDGLEERDEDTLEMTLGGTGKLMSLLKDKTLRGSTRKGVHWGDLTGLISQQTRLQEQRKAELAAQEPNKKYMKHPGVKGACYFE